jgi:hypothetical protein
MLVIYFKEMLLPFACGDCGMPQKRMPGKPVTGLKLRH